MPNTIQVVRCEPKCCAPTHPHSGKVAELVVGITMTSGDYSAYIDGVTGFDPCVTIDALNSGLNDTVSQVIVNNGWSGQLENQLVAIAQRTVPAEGYVAPDITLNLG